MSKRRCDKCEWWARNKNKPRKEQDDDCPLFDYHQELDETLGQCRIYPPSVGVGEYYSMFPVTKEDCWCGMFKKARGEE